MDCSTHTRRYELNELTWQTTVEKIARKAGDYQLFEISGVKITKSEKISETPSEKVNTNEIKDNTPTPKKRVRRQIKSN